MLPPDQVGLLVFGVVSHAVPVPVDGTSGCVLSARTAMRIEITFAQSVFAAATQLPPAPIGSCAGLAQPLIHSVLCTTPSALLSNPYCICICTMLSASGDAAASLIRFWYMSWLPWMV